MTDNEPRSATAWPNGVDLATDTWTLSGQWDQRPEDGPASCTERMLACVTRLAKVDPLFSEWYYDDEPDDITPSGLRERFEERWHESFPDEDNGIGLTVWNGVTDDLGFSRISLSCWPTAAGVRFGVDFLPPTPAALPGLYRPDAMLRLFEIVLSSWNPLWCRIQPSSLGEAAEGEMADVLASWIVYLESERYEQKGDLPAEVRVTDGADGRGRFFVLAPTPEEMRLDTVERLRHCLVLPVTNS